MSAPTSPPVRVTHFPLTYWHLRTLSICGTIMILSASPSFVSPGSPLWDYGLVHTKLSLATVQKAQSIVFYLLWGCHGLELPPFVVLKMRKHGVSPFSLLGLQWMGALFFSGMPTWDLFALAIKNEEEKKR